MANINKNEIGYNENTTANALMVQYKRGLAAPMDISEVFTSLELAQFYASSDPIAYAGQSIAVAGDGIKTEIYKITSGGTLVRMVDENDLASIKLPDNLATTDDVKTATESAISSAKTYVDDKLIDFEKKLLIEDINRLYDNKSQYATRRFLDIMLKDEKCRFSSIGTVEDAKAITKESLTETYNNMLNSKHIVYVIGDISEEKIKDAFSNFHLKDEISEKLDFIDYETKKIEKVTEVVEEQKIRQSIVLMGYRSEIRLNDDLYNGMFMLSSMLGGYFHSTLFQEIREKRSLAYSVSCDYNPRKGNFAIFAGISASKYDEFKSVVNQIIEDYQNGNIDDNVFELTKKSIISGIYKSADQQTYGIGFVLNEISGIENHTIEEKVNRVLSITKEEVIDAAKCLVLDTIYFLKGTL